MAVAIRTITRLQDADDVNVSLGAGVDEYALSWDNDTAMFVLRAVAAGVTDHGALTGLTPDDDHTQYALLAGRAGGQTLYGGTAENDDITIHGTSNATRTTSYVLLQPTAGNVGIGTSAPSTRLELVATTANIPVFRVTNNSSMSFIHSFELLAPNISAGQTLYMALGKEGTTYNRAAISFVYVGSGDATNRLVFAFYGADNLVNILASGNVGIGTTAPRSRLHALLNSAATNAVTNVLTIGHDTSGTAANGFGAGQLFALESSTTAEQSAARIQAIWNDATHATRKADLVLTAYDTAEREGLRIRGNGSAAAIGFLGAAPAARQAHVADPSGGATVDAEARSAINSILATLETFGFHATS